VKFELRDPNWNTNAGAQAVTSLISEKPAVIVVHNPDVQTYAKLLQRAENEGIYVIQINMGSAYRSSGFVGANWIEIGEKDTEAGVTGKVFVATSGGGERKGACELVKTGALDLDLSYDVPTQAAQMAGLIKYLL